MGKKDKDHRAKVAKRNQRISIAKKKFEREYQNMMSQKIEEMRQKFAAMSGDTDLFGGENQVIEDAEVIETKEEPTEDQSSELEK